MGGLASPSSVRRIGDVADVLPGARLCTEAIGSASDNSGARSLDSFLDSLAGTAGGARLTRAGVAGVGVAAADGVDGDHT
jgi:hypothetical protein